MGRELISSHDKRSSDFIWNSPRPGQGGSWEMFNNMFILPILILIIIIINGGGLISGNCRFQATHMSSASSQIPDNFKKALVH